MKDIAFIKEMLQQGKDAMDTVKIEFSNITSGQLNWKPLPDKWSIGQCLDHLIVSDSSYFPTLKNIAEGKHKMTAWERWNPFSGICGRILVHQLQVEVKKKMNAPGVFHPSTEKIDLGIIERFHEHQDTLLEYIAQCDKVDLDKVYITSPAIKIVTYSLRNAIRILIQHEWRHINQALRVKLREDFLQKSD
jgi:DinB superfamily